MLSDESFQESKEISNGEDSFGALNKTVLKQVKSNKLQVFIIQYTSIDEIYVCLKKNEEASRQMHADVQRLAQTFSQHIFDSWNVNDHCLVPYKQSTVIEWFRGKITEMYDDGTSLVFLRDIGISIKIDSIELKQIIYKLQRVENLAIKCRLSSIEMNPSITKDDFKINFSEITKRFDGFAISLNGRQNGTKELSVILWGAHIVYNALKPSTYKWVNINEELCKFYIVNRTGTFISDTPELPSATIERDSLEKNGLPKNEVSDKVVKVKQWMPAEPQSETIFYAHVTYVNRNGIIYALSHDRKAIADKISDIIEKKHLVNELLKRSNLSEWKKNKPCFTLFSDGRFYRAKIRELYSDGLKCAVSVKHDRQLKQCFFGTFQLLWCDTL